MAYIELDYILIEKQLDDEKTVEQITLDYFCKTGYEYKEGYFETTDGKRVEYKIEHKKKSDRYYLNLSTDMRLNKAIEELQKFDDAITKSDYNKYVNPIRVYDGISETLCKKLYPKYGIFERKLRQLILLVLTKAFGNNIIRETISEDKQKELKERVKGGNLKISETLEQFDLKQLEEYLFADREVDYNIYFKTQLAENIIGSLSEEDLREKIETIRPKSLWASNFSDIGDENNWKEKILAVHDLRNTVAHHKTIKYEQFKDVNNKLNQLNRDINRAIIEIQDRDFTDKNSFDILNSFATLVNQISKNYISIAENIGVAFKKIMEPISSSLMENAFNAFQQAGERINLLVSSLALPDYFDGLSTINDMKIEPPIIDMEVLDDKVDYDKDDNI